jgi:hypothetical protein
MSLLAKKNIGLVIISALLIFSCKEKEKIGLQLPEDNVAAFFTDTLSLTTSVTIKNDDIATHNQSYIYSGLYNDPIFGEISANAFTQLTLKTENINTLGAVVDSVVMNLEYDYHYGDTTLVQNIHVHKLTQDLDKTAIYNSDDVLTYNPSAVDSTSSFKARPVTSPNLKLYLKAALGTDILAANTLNPTNAVFATNFKGLALVADDATPGALLRFKLFDNTSTITIYYKVGGTVQAPFELLINTSGARFSNITSDFSIPANTNKSNGQGGTTGEVYLQSGIGIRTKINIPTLENFKNKLGTIAINRAELVLEVDEDEIKPGLVTYDPVGLVHLLKLDNTGNVRKYTDANGNLEDEVVQRDFYDVSGHTAPLSVSYDKNLKTYNFNISSYFHALLNGVEANNGLIIAPHPLVANTSVNRTLAGSKNAKVYMRIYYTKVD